MNRRSSLTLRLVLRYLGTHPEVSLLLIAALLAAPYILGL